MSTNETTKSLLHYNECAADSGAPCTCEPPLTTVEEVTVVLFGCHVLEFIDAETGWACGCDEDGYLELLTLENARKHQAEAMLAEVAPLIKAQALAEVRKNQLGMARGFAHDAEAQYGRSESISARAEGAAWAAVAQLQMLLMELGEVEFDEAAECTWDIVQNRAGGSR